MTTLRSTILALLFPLLLLINACEPDSCLHGNKRITTVRVETDSFNYISIHDMFDVILVQDTGYYVEFKGGAKSLEYVQAVNDSAVLNCYNTNSCAFLRGYKKIGLYIHFRRVQRMDIFDVCKITSEKPVTSNVYLTVQADMADVDLLLDCDRLYFWANMTSGGIYKFRGKCQYASLAGYYAAKIDSRELAAKEMQIKNFSVADFDVYATAKLIAEIHNSGDIYYSGNPEVVVDTIKEGSGRLIKVTGN